MRGYTSTDGIKEHYHEFVIDEDKDGRTIRTLGEGDDHVHSIVNGIVMGVDPNNHVHYIDLEEK